MGKIVVNLLTAIVAITALSNVSACPISKAEEKSGAHCVDMGGYQMYIKISEQKNPTIVFDAGSGDDSSVWNKVAPIVENFAQAVVYDRVGLGKSQPDSKMQPVTSQDVINSLRALLKKENLKPPYILVGHSRGGLNMQLFAEEYPQEVTGMVLIDSVSRNQTHHDAPPAKTANYYLEAITAKQSIEQVKKAGKFPNIPLIVLSATCHHLSPAQETQWQTWQHELTLLSTQSQQIIAYGSPHYIQQRQPQLVIDAIATMVNKVGKLDCSKACKP